MRHYIVGSMAVMILLFNFNTGFANAGTQFKSEKTKLNEKYEISGPYSHENLSIFLIHGKDAIDGKKFITLAEALKSGKATIHETGNVNKLTAQNNSKDTYVFIQSGDIVKGGKQDRTLAQDLILPPQSKKIPIDSFCVEQGRWKKRGNETLSNFSSSTKYLNSKNLKLAAKKAKSQNEVWKNVSVEQNKLSKKVGKSVKAKESTTSLQLSLEDKTIQKKSKGYMDTLLPIGKKQTDAVGFAFTINGEFNTADVYGNTDLFQKLWPKLLESSSFEALSLHTPLKKIPETKLAVMKREILGALNSPTQKEKSAPKTIRKTGDTKNQHIFQTTDEMNQMIHWNVIWK